MLADRRFAPLLRLDIDHLIAPPGQEVVEVFRRAMKLLRAEDEVHVRQPVDQLAPAALGHATHEPEHDVRAAAANVGCEVLHLVERLLLRHVAHTAGVEQDHVRDVFRGRQVVTPGQELRGDGFAVPLIHLATVGFDIDTRHGRSAVKLREQRRVEKLQIPSAKLSVGMLVCGNVVQIQFQRVGAGLLDLLCETGPATGCRAIEAGDDGNGL